MADPLIKDLAAALVNVASDVLGAEDDAYNPQTLRLSRNDLLGAPFPQETLSRGDDPTTVDYTHKLVLSGTDDGGDQGAYALYFDVQRAHG